MQRVFLIGPRASGKTTLAKAMAKRLGWTLFDTDEEITARLGASVSEIVSLEGWEGFRRRERDLLRAVIAETEGKAAIISTGGGIVLLKENRRMLAKSGTCLYLHVPVEELAMRLAAVPQASQRPSLTGRNLVDEVAEVVRAREPLYMEAADCILDGSVSAEALCESAMRAIRKNSRSSSR